ncbi:methyltransferase [Rhodospirillaceae bacterium]|nr:methyltransferase [Rhodospirillaceae bacterium]
MEVTIDQALQRGVAAHKAGNLQEAEKLYRAILQTQPQHPDANHNLGVLAVGVGQVENSLSYFKAALASNAKIEQYWLSYIDALIKLERLSDARQVLDQGRLSGLQGDKLAQLDARLRKPIDPIKDSFIHLQKLRKQGGTDQARLDAMKLLKQFPLSTKLRRFLLEASLELGHCEFAERESRRVCCLEPRDVETMLSLGEIYGEVNRHRSAVICLNRALIINTTSAPAICQLLVLQKKNGFDTEKYLANPDNDDFKTHLKSLFELAGRLQDENDLLRAIAIFSQILEIDPSFPEVANKLDDAITKVVLFLFKQNSGGFSFTEYSRSVSKVFEIALNRPALFRPKEIIAPLSSLIKRHPRIKSLLIEFSETKEIKDIDAAVAKLSGIDLLLNSMSICPIMDLELEAFLTYVRRRFLGLEFTNKAWQQGRCFYEALVLQCWVNEYIWHVTNEEQGLLSELEDRLILGTFSHSIEQKFDYLRLACFKPLNKETDLSSLRDIVQHHEIEKRLVHDVLTEERLARTMPNYGNVEESNSDVIRQQYEQNPYPRWVQTRLSFRSRSLEEFAASRHLNVKSCSLVKTKRPQVLVAGCGTGQNSITAAKRYSQCDVVAVDFSLKSLCYAQRKTDEYGIKNIKYLHANLLDLKGFGNFDVIECAGVLHHLEDPTEGLGVLTSILTPGGLLFLGLYSKIARQPVIAARDLISKHGLNTDCRKLAKCRHQLLQLEDTNVDTLSRWSDFYSASEFRDLLFNNREHCYELSQVQILLDTFSLKFLGFEAPGPAPAFREKFADRFPDKNINDLSAWEQYEKENPTAFSGMYQFWCQKEKP